MKLLQIIYSGLGGHGSVAFSLIDADQEQQFRHQMLFYGVEDVKPEYLERCHQQGVQQAFVRKRGNVRSWWRVWRQLWRLKPDAILLHSTTAIFPCFAYAFLRRKKVYAVDHQANERKRKQDWWFARFNVRLAHRYVVLTEHSAQGIKERFPAVKKRLRVINNGIDLNLFKPIEHKPMKQTVSMLGRMNELRDFRSLVEAFDLLGEEFPELELVLAGDGEDLPKILQRCEASPFRERIHLPGTLEEKAVAELLQQSTVYVHSSLADNMSTAVMQAMATETVVLATDIPGLRQLINPDETGLLFEPGNVYELTGKLRLLLQDTLKRQILSHAALWKARQQFGHQKMFEAYQQLIRE